MRMLLLAAVVAVLAVPTAALADGGGSTSPGVATRLAEKKAKKGKKLHVELKRSKSGAAGAIRTRELEGLVTSLAPLTIASSRQGSASLTCDVPAGVSLAGLKVGDRAEITCDLVGARWVLRKLEQKGHAKAVDQGGAQGSTSACDDDDDDSGKLDDNDDDCGQQGDDDHEDEDDGDDD